MWPYLFERSIRFTMYTVCRTLKQLYTDCQAAVDVNGTYTAFLILVQV